MDSVQDVGSDNGDDSRLTSRNKHQKLEKMLASHSFFSSISRDMKRKVSKSFSSQKYCKVSFRMKFFFLVEKEFLFFLNNSKREFFLTFKEQCQKNKIYPLL